MLLLQLDLFNTGRVLAGTEIPPGGGRTYTTYATVGGGGGGGAGLQFCDTLRWGWGGEGLDYSLRYMCCTVTTNKMSVLGMAAV